MSDPCSTCDGYGEVPPPHRRRAAIHALWGRLLCLQDHPPLQDRAVSDLHTPHKPRHNPTNGDPSAFLKSAGTTHLVVSEVALDARELEGSSGSHGHVGFVEDVLLHLGDETRCDVHESALVFVIRADLVRLVGGNEFCGGNCNRWLSRLRGRASHRTGGALARAGTCRNSKEDAESAAPAAKREQDPNHDQRDSSPRQPLLRRGQWRGRIAKRRTVARRTVRGRLVHSSRLRLAACRVHVLAEPSDLPPFSGAGWRSWRC